MEVEAIKECHKLVTRKIKDVKTNGRMNGSSKGNGKLESVRQVACKEHAKGCHCFNLEDVEEDLTEARSGEEAPRSGASGEHESWGDGGGP